MAAVTDEDEHGDAAQAETTEDTPLLRPTDNSDEADHLLGEPRALLRQNVIILTFIILFLLEAGANTMVPPLNELLEGIICRQHYPEQAGLLPTNDPESVCKSPDIQGKLAMTRAWITTIECIPGILLAVPYGILADKWGRRPVLFLGVLGIVIEYVLVSVILALPDVFPYWMTCVVALMRVIGGGNNVASAMMYTCIADVVVVADRATVFFQATAVDLSSSLVANPLAGMLMEISPWLALLVGLGMMIISNIAILFFPETNVVHSQAHKPVNTEENTAPENGTTLAHGDGEQSLIQRTLQNARNSVAETLDFISANKSVAFLITSLVFVVLGRFVNEMLLQYATKRYHWTWAQAAYLLTVNSASNMVVLLVILPSLSWLCVSVLHMPATVKDLLLARCSAVMLVLGSLIIAFAVNGYILTVGLVVISSGIGLSALVRSLANSLVEEHHIGMLNTLVGMIFSIALMIAGPLLSSTLSVGFRMGGAWIGLPFICAAAMFSISLTVVLVYRLPPGKWTAGPGQP